MAARIDYDAILSNAKVSIIKEIMRQVEENGINGKQGLFVTCELRHPDVVISDYLRKDFGEEMTIVLQHEFWNLQCDDFGFSVGLAFENGDEEIYIPYSSISNINDPSEDFYLDFIPDFSKRRQQSAVLVDKSNSGNIISFDSFRKSH